MRKLAELTQFLIALDLVAVERIDSWAEDPRIIPSGKINTGGSIVLYRHEYDAVISFDRWPYREHPAELLFAQVCAWIINHDADRDDNAQPRIDVDVIDDNVAEITITIDFEEDVYGVADPAGPVVIGGIHYRLADPIIDYALSGEVVT